MLVRSNVCRFGRSICELLQLFGP